MLRFSLFGIPVGVEWWFWLSCIVLGNGFSASGPEDWMRVGVWTFVVFISIIVHELGHAFAGRRFGANPHIKLHGFGGVTILPGRHFSRKESIMVSAAGPAAGLLLGIAVYGIAPLVPADLPLMRLMIRYALYVNIFWTFVNLLPIQPMDGGQILRDLLGPSRMTLTSRIGFVLAVLLGIWALKEQMIFMALMLGMFAYYNYRQQPVEGGVIKG